MSLLDFGYRGTLAEDDPFMLALQIQQMQGGDPRQGFEIPASVSSSSEQADTDHQVLVFRKVQSSRLTSYFLSKEVLWGVPWLVVPSS